MPRARPAIRYLGEARGGGGEVSGLSFRGAVWLIPAAFVLHVTEEWPRFTAWANRYASDSFTQHDYVVIHLGGIAGSVLLAGLLATFPNRALVFLAFAFFVLPALFWNVVFHAGATVVFGAYCPGLVTAVCVYPPVVYIVSRLCLRDGLLSPPTGFLALGLAGTFHFWEVGHNVFRAW
jgi:hypothetical protein